jgi:hypothetical protein
VDPLLAGSYWFYLFLSTKQLYLLNQQQKLLLFWNLLCTSDGSIDACQPNNYMEEHQHRLLLLLLF